MCDSARYKGVETAVAVFSASVPWGLFKSTWYFFCVVLGRQGSRSCDYFHAKMRGSRRTAKSDRYKAALLESDWDFSGPSLILAETSDHFALRICAVDLKNEPKTAESLIKMKRSHLCCRKTSSKGAKKCSNWCVTAHPELTNFCLTLSKSEEFRRRADSRRVPRWRSYPPMERSSPRWP